MKKINVAIVGGSGLVGEKIVKVLRDEKMISRINLSLYVSSKSAGKVVKYFGNI